MDVCPAWIQVRSFNLKKSLLLTNRNPDTEEILDMTNLLPVLRDEIIVAFDVSIIEAPTVISAAKR